jgi:hypothetical protein
MRENMWNSYHQAIKAYILLSYMVVLWALPIPHTIMAVGLGLGILSSN